MRGARPVDQRWIDETVAVGVEVFDWKIAPRPVEIDAPPKPKPAVKAGLTPAKRPAWLDLFPKRKH